MDKRKRGALVAGLVIIAVMAVVAVYLLIFNGNDSDPQVTSQANSVCEIEPLAGEIGLNLIKLNGEVEEFKPTADKLLSTAEYQNSLTCLSILSRYFILSGSYKSAAEHTAKLEELHSQTGDYKSIVLGNINKAHISELKEQVEILKSNSENVNNQGGHFGIPEDVQ